MTRMPLSFLPIDIGIGGLPSNWWDEINESVKWQDGLFFTLCAAYGLVSLVALIQLIRIELRVPEHGWTTQKVFHLMNFIVNGVRAVMFGFHKLVFLLHPRMLTLLLLDLPGLLFFSTYTLLVLFWAEIYHQARSLPTDKLRLFYFLINGGIYFIQVCIWVYLWIDDNSAVEFLGKIFIAVVSFIAALGFLLYGGRLFFMLRRFPIESKGRRKKLHEGYAAGNAIPSPLKNVEKEFLKKYWAKWKASHTGRCRAMPHIKTFTRYNGQNLAWFLLTSANLSKAAWGALQKKQFSVDDTLL